MPIGSTLAPYLPLVEGKTVTGEIVDFRIQQKSDYDTNRPLYFERNAEGRVSKGFAPFGPDGTPNEPICDWVFTLDVGEEDENGETERRVYLDPRKGQKGTAVEGKRGRDAVETALKRAKAHRVGLEIGGRISITRGPKVQPKKGDAACVTYEASYEPPAGGPGAGRPVDEVPYLVGGGRYTGEAQAPAPAVGSFGNLRPAGEPTGAQVSAGGAGVMVTAPAGHDEDPPF